MSSRQATSWNVRGRNNGLVCKTNSVCIEVQDNANEQYCEKRNQYVDKGASIKAGRERLQTILWMEDGIARKNFS